MGQLTVDDSSRIRGDFDRTTWLHQLSGVTDGREGVPQFMGKRRQELVFAAIGISQLVLECAPLRQVAHHYHPAIRQWRAVPYRYKARVNPLARFDSRTHLPFVVDGFTLKSP